MIGENVTSRGEGVASIMMMDVSLRFDARALRTCALAGQWLSQLRMKHSNKQHLHKIKIE
jgi:hypothetical protein